MRPEAERDAGKDTHATNYKHQQLGIYRIQILASPRKRRSHEACERSAKISAKIVVRKVPGCGSCWVHDKVVVISGNGSTLFARPLFLFARTANINRAKKPVGLIRFQARMYMDCEPQLESMSTGVTSSVSGHLWGTISLTLNLPLPQNSNGVSRISNSSQLNFDE